MLGCLKLGALGSGRLTCLREDTGADPLPEYFLFTVFQPPQRGSARHILIPLLSVSAQLPSGWAGGLRAPFLWSSSRCLQDQCLRKAPLRMRLAAVPGWGKEGPDARVLFTNQRQTQGRRPGGRGFVVPCPRHGLKYRKGGIQTPVGRRAPLSKLKALLPGLFTLTSCSAKSLSLPLAAISPGLLR